MKTKELSAIAKIAFANHPEFVILGDLAVKQPMNGILRGVSFEGSDFGKTAFYMNYFVMPLCVPRKYRVLSFGDRVRTPRRADRWAIEDEGYADELRHAIETKVIPYLSRFDTREAFARSAAALAVNPRMHGDVAYVLAAVGDTKGALAWLEKALTALPSDFEWHHEFRKELSSFQKMLIADPEEARAQLQTWEEESIRNLKLDQLLR